MLFTVDVLGEIDRRVRYLSKRLDVVEVVHQMPPRRDRVHFGATVTLETSEGSEIRYRIVGADEIDARKGYTSVDSPMSRALLGRSVDDSIKVQSPEGSSAFLILNITYG